MKNKKIVIVSSFNNAKYTEARLTKEWIENRLDIFERFTLKGFKAQVNQEFEAYLQCDETTMSIINECLSHRETLPQNVHFDTVANCNKGILKDLDQYQFLYWVRVDSDNIYHKDFVEKLHQYVPKEETEVIISQNGYVYDGRDGALASYYQPSPPFYAYVYKAEDYINKKRYSSIGGHGNVIKILKYELLEGNNYIVTLHGKNVLNERHLLKKDLMIENPEKKAILAEFGMDEEI